MLDRVTGGPFAFFVWKVNKWLADPDSLFTACPWAAIQMVARPTYSQYQKYSSTFLYHVFSVSSSKLLRRGHKVWLFSVVAGQCDVLSAQWLSLLARHLVLIQKDPSFRFLGFPCSSGSWILTFLVVRDDSFVQLVLGLGRHPSLPSIGFVSVSSASALQYQPRGGVMVLTCSWDQSFITSPD